MELFSTLLTPSTANELIAGSFAGAAQVIVGQPLDTIKVRAQIAPREFLLPLIRKLLMSAEGMFVRLPLSRTVWNEK